MKKLLSILFVFALLFALCVPASAIKGAPVVFDGINKISFEGPTYVAYPRSYKIEVLDQNSWEYLPCEFDDEETELLYDYFEATPYENCDIVLGVGYGDRKHNTSTNLFYIREDCIESVNALVDNPETATGYKFKSQQDQCMDLPADVMAGWVNEANRVQFDDYDRGRLFSDVYCVLYATDSSGYIGVPVGCVYFENAYNNGAAYLVMYNEYETNDFYADGSLAVREIDELWGYRLSDEAYSDKLNGFSIYYPDDVYIDDFNDEPDEEITAFFSVLLFAVAPFIVMVVSAIALIKRRKERKNPYRLPLWLMLCSAAVIIICFAVVMGIIL